jgi:hypothetical protein
MHDEILILKKNLGRDNRALEDSKESIALCARHKRPHANL